MKYLVPFISILLLSCGSSKTIFKTVVDSTRIQELQDSLSLSKSETEFYQNLVNDLSFGIVRFDTVFHNDTILNTVIVKDGNIEAKGRVKEVIVYKDKTEFAFRKLQTSYDSLLQVKQKVVTETHTEYKDKIVKRKFQWWIFLIIFFAGAIFDRKFGQYFKLPRL